MKPAELKAVADVCHMLADPTRVSIVTILSRGPKPVMSLCREMKRQRPMVSHHLDLLRMSGLVDREQKGREMHYSLNYGKLGTARSFLAKVK